MENLERKCILEVAERFAPGPVLPADGWLLHGVFVEMEKNATEKDVKRTRKEIVTDLLKYNEKFREQVESPKPSK